MDNDQEYEIFKRKYRRWCMIPEESKIRAEFANLPEYMRLWCYEKIKDSIPEKFKRRK